MVNIQSPTAEISEEKRRKKERNYRMKILWSALLHRATIIRNLRSVAVHLHIRRFACATLEDGRSTCWRLGVVASVVRRMNEVTLRRARLVLGLVTVFGRVHHHGM